MIPKIIGVALIAAIAGAILSEMGCKSKRVFITLSLVVISLGLAAELTGIFSQLMKISDSTGVTELTKCALKIVGLGYVFGISCDVCAELGEKSLSEALSLFGRIEMFLITLPYIKEIALMGARLIG